MELDVALRAAIYSHLVRTAEAPTVEQLARALGRPAADISEGWQRLASRRIIVLTSDGTAIRMALPFSGVETQHRVRVLGRTYYANCAWDSFGIPAALRAHDAEVLSRCEQTLEPLQVHVGPDGPPHTPWVFHAAVPAAHWWRDIVHT
jgi:hypothetical protein